MPKRNSLLTFLVLAGLVLVIVALHYMGVLRPVENGLTRLFTPVAGSFQRLASLIRPDATEGLSHEELSRQLRAVEEENRRLLTGTARLAELEAENERLRHYLDFLEVSKEEYVMTEVVAQGSAADSWRNREAITLNRGSADGLAPGLPLVSAEGVLMGKIIRAEEHIAEACLLYSRDCRISVSLSGEPGTIGIAQGDLGLTIKVDFIPQNRKISEDQLVVTSGLEQGMPAGLVIGRISRVINQGNELWQNALIEPTADFEDVRILSVLK